MQKLPEDVTTGDMPKEERVSNKSTFHLTTGKWKFLLILLIIFMVITTGLIYWGLIKGSVACKTQPFLYGAEYLSDKYNEANVECNCIIQSLNDGKIFYYEFTNKDYKNIFNIPNLSKLYANPDLIYK